MVIVLVLLLMEAEETMDTLEGAGVALRTAEGEDTAAARDEAASEDGWAEEDGRPDTDEAESKEERGT